MGWFDFNQKKARGSRKLGAEALCGIVYGSPIPQFVIDKNHMVVYWNQALAEYSGMKSEDMIGTNRQWQAFYVYERPCMADLLVDQRITMIPRLYKGKYSKSKLVPEAYEATDFFPAMGKAGKWLYFTAAAIRDAHGDIVGAVETLEDITDRKAAEDELRKRASKLQDNKKALIRAVQSLDIEKIALAKEKAKAEAILMSIGDGLVITAGPEGRILLTNAAFDRMTGWGAREIAGRSLFEVMPCQDEKGAAVPSEKRFISRVLAGERPETATFYYVRKDGTRFPGAVTVTEIGFEGERLGAVSVLRDVTREIEMDRAKSEFISLASHQLRDAPTAISWCAEALLIASQGPLNKGQKEYVEEIYRRNKGSIGLINDLLNVSRIDLGTFIIEPEEVSLKDICKSELKQFELPLKEKQLVLEEDYDASIPPINADPQLVQVVFQNLISNAIYYTPEGGRITIGLLKSAGGIVFKVADTGYGIPQDQQSKIFGRMFRADNAKVVRSGGSGLGLYVAKSILDQAGWKIRFESREGKGTVFYVDIPLSGMISRPGQTKLTRGIV